MLNVVVKRACRTLLIIICLLVNYACEIGLCDMIRIVVHTWKTMIHLMSCRCGGKAAGDPIYKHQRPFKSSIERSMYA